MTESTQLRDIAKLMMEKAKENLLRFKDSFMPTSFIVKDNRVVDIMGGNFSSQNAKEAYGKKVAERARREDADAVYFVADAHYKTMPIDKAADVLKNYRHGDLAKEQANEALVGTIFGPDVSFAIVQPYSRKNGEIVFKRQTTEIGGQQTVIPRWW